MARRRDDDRTRHAEVINLETEDERRQRFDDLRQRRQRSLRTFGIARRPVLDENKVQQHYCGLMNVVCQHCQALYFPGEKVGSLCCQKGQVNLPPPPECPQPLKALYTGDHPKSAAFIKDIRRFNGALAFASMGMTD